MQVADALETLGAPYAIGGSFACAIHGVMRATMDAALIADLPLSDAEPLARALAGEFYADEESMREAVRHARSFNLIHFATMFKVMSLSPRHGRSTARNWRGTTWCC